MQLRFFRKEMRAKQSWPWYLASPLAVGAAYVLYNSFEFSQSDKFPFIFFYPAILLVAVVGGTGPGIFALLLSVLVSGYFLWPPTGWEIREESDWIALFIFVAMSSIMVALAAWGRSVSRLASEALDQLQAQENRSPVSRENTPIILYAL